jgi:hypothetical protein
MTRKGMNLFAMKAVSLAAMAARVSQLQPRIRRDWLPAHENFTRSTANDDSPGFSLIAK